MFFTQQSDVLSYITSLIVFIIFLYFFAKIQNKILEFSIKEFIRELEIYDNSSRLLLYELILDFYKEGNYVSHTQVGLLDINNKLPNRNTKNNDQEINDFRYVRDRINEIIESFTIMPVTLDPSGIIERLDHILRVRENRLMHLVEKIIPDAPMDIKYDLENALEAASAIHLIYKLVKHYYEANKFYDSPIILYQLQLIMPVLKALTKVYYDALRAFRSGIPIGDSIGPLIATKFFSDKTELDIKEKMVYSINEYMGRTIIAVKAMGPGGNVGHPGRFLVKLIEDSKNKVNLVITVDAAIKFEGEKSGDIAIGFGAAIGDPGPEKYQIEEICTKYGIPYFAVVIKESITEAITPLSKELIESVDRAYHKILRLIEEETKEGDSVIIMGIGNSIGVSNEKVK